MPNGILIIDKPAGWTSMDVCAPASLGLAGDPKDFNCSGEMNSPCANLRLRLRFYAPSGAPRCAEYSCGIIPRFVP